MELVKETPKTRHKTNREKPKKKFAVVMYNDDVTAMEFVVMVLMQIFDYNVTDAFNIMLQIHMGTKMTVATYGETLAYAKRNETIQLARANGFREFKVEVEEV